MSQSRLQAFYERKYASDATVSELTEVRKVSQPTDRFEAAVKFIPQYFNGGSILELGAGSGVVAKTLLGLDIGIETYTLGDISLPRVNGIAKSIRDDRVTVRHVDAERLSEEDEGLYDAVVMIALIEHLIDPLRAMESLRKRLKPHGIAYIDTPNIAKYTRRAQLLMGRFPATASKDEGLTTHDDEPADLHDERGGPGNLNTAMSGNSAL